MKNSLKKLSFVIPAYNEERSIEAILNKIDYLDFGLEKEFVIVDDASKDSTFQIISKFKNDSRYKILKNDTNLGKSQTVKKGILETTGDLVVIQDSDLEYDPTDLIQFVEAFKNENVDLIYGNRFGKKNKVIYKRNWIGNTFLSLFSSFFTLIKGGYWTRDMEVCYKMSKGEIFRDIAETVKSESNFGLEPELTAKFAKYRKEDKSKLKFMQLPISYYPRTVAEGKKIHALKDGLRAIIEILRFNLT